MANASHRALVLRTKPTSWSLAFGFESLSLRSNRADALLLNLGQYCLANELAAAFVLALSNLVNYGNKARRDRNGDKLLWRRLSHV
jgi:hypothetical protein